MKKQFISFALFFLSFLCKADMHPSFSLIENSINASEIVRVSLLNEIKGEFLIIETWKGSLKKGEKITIPPLSGIQKTINKIVFDTTEEQVFSNHSFHLRKPISCKNMVLFLYGNASEWKPASLRDYEVRRKGTLSPEILKADFINSCAWILNDTVFALQQLTSPGPIFLYPLHDYSKQISIYVREVHHSASFKKYVLRFVAIENRLKKIKTIKNLSVRADSLVWFYKAGWMTDSVSFIMKSCGINALPVIEKMLADTSFLPVQGMLIIDYVLAGEKEAGPKLTQWIKEETEFWKLNQSKIPHVLYNTPISGNDYKTLEPYKNHWHYLQSLLTALQKIKYPQCKKTIMELKEFWVTIPNDKKNFGLSYITETCTEILKN